MQQISILIVCILFPFLSFSQDLTGIWNGSDVQEISSQVIPWSREVFIKQDGNKLSGKAVDLQNGTKNYSVAEISGKIKNGKVKIYIDQIVKINFPEPTFNDFVWRHSEGMLIVDEINNMLILELKSFGTCKYYDFITKKFSEGNCTPKTWRLTKKYRDKENQSLIVEDSSKQTNANKSQIIPIDKKEIKLFTKSVKIKVWDRFEEDADIINLYLNGKIIFPNLRVTKKGELLEIELISGINIIEVEAINEGNVSPNTSAVSIFTNNQQHDITLSAKKGERDSLKIILD